MRSRYTMYAADRGRRKPRAWIAAPAAAVFSWAASVPIGGAASPEAQMIPPPAGAVTDIGSFVGTRLRANREGYLKPFDIEKYTAMVETPRHRDWWWIGEQPGKWLESAALEGRRAPDAALEARARAILDRLVKAQDPSGYLGITDPSVRTAAQPLRGMDPYELYFTLHGLLTAHEVFGDARAREAARRLGDYFVNMIGSGKAEFWPSTYRPPENRNLIVCPQYAWVPEGTRKAPDLQGHSAIAGHTAHYGWEGTLLIDPMMRLYEATGDAKYLEWVKWVVSRIDTWSGWDSFSRLDDVAAGRLGLHQLQPYVHTHTFQMNFLGFLRLYRATDDASLLRKVQGAWADTVKRQLYLTGGVSVGEHYEPGLHKPVSGHVVETCANMSWMQLNQALLELTAESKYAEIMERLLWNHVFAAQTVDGDCHRYHTPPNGLKPREYFHGPDCCTASGHRLDALLPSFLLGVARGRVYVNQFVPLTARLNLHHPTNVALRLETDYPEGEKVRITVTPQEPVAFAVHVRIPAWCAAPEVRVNGEAVRGVKSGAYLELERTWKQGDRIDLRFPMALRWIRSDGGETKEPAPEAERRWALTRGPVVYALDTVWWNDPKAAAPADIGQEVAVTPADSPAYDAMPTPAGLLGPCFLVPVETPAGPARAPAVPFANAGVWYRPGGPKPDRSAAAYSYAAWLMTPGSAAFRAARTEAAEARAALSNAVDAVIIGSERSEKAHALRGTSSSGPFSGRTYRHSRQWFSYEVRVLPDTPTDLVCTWWGDDVDRTFDILVNERQVATETLNRNRPGEFFSVRYPIPFDLIRGRTDDLGKQVTKVTVKFAAGPGSTAGGLFGLRVEERPK